MDSLAGYTDSDDDLKGPKHGDVNYDTVNMDMSDEEGTGGAGGNESESERLFSSRDEYLAYKNQFKSSAKKSGTNDYGTNEYGGGSELPSEFGKRKQNKRRSPPPPRTKESSSEQEESRSDPASAGSDPRSRKSDPDHRRHRRSRSRSGDRRRQRSPPRRERRRSRDRGRRSRSPRRDNRRDRRDDRDQQSRQDRRNRKLQSMGIGAEEASRTVEDQVAKVKELTGVDLPKYYNPAAINPLRYAEQIKKRKMLWSKPSGDGGGVSADAPEKAPAAAVVMPPQNTNHNQPQTSFNQWETTNLGDSRANEKFRRLMGIKSSAPAPPAAKGHAPVKDTEKMFREQEQQYERARAATHTQRGLGLGFSGAAATAAAPPDPAPSAVPPHLQGNPLLSKINFVRK